MVIIGALLILVLALGPGLVSFVIALLLSKYVGRWLRLQINNAWWSSAFIASFFLIIFYLVNKAALLLLAVLFPGLGFVWFLIGLSGLGLVAFLIGWMWRIVGVLIAVRSVLRTQSTDIAPPVADSNWAIRIKYVTPLMLVGALFTLYQPTKNLVEAIPYIVEHKGDIYNDTLRTIKDASISDEDRQAESNTNKKLTDAQSLLEEYLTANGKYPLTLTELEAWVKTNYDGNFVVSFADLTYTQSDYDYKLCGYLKIEKEQKCFTAPPKPFIIENVNIEPQPIVWRSNSPTSPTFKLTWQIRGGESLTKESVFLDVAIENSENKWVYESKLSDFRAGTAVLSIPPACHLLTATICTDATIQSGPAKLYFGGYVCPATEADPTHCINPTYVPYAIIPILIEVKP